MFGRGTARPPGPPGYISISEVQRWRRHGQPIPSGPSDDDRTGGGVSLTAVSDVDDKDNITRFSSRPSAPDSKANRPVTPGFKLRGDAQSFESSIREVSTESSNVDTSPTSVESDSFSSSEPQPFGTKSVRPTANASDNDTALKHTMASYSNSRHRSRSAVAPRQDERVGHGSSTAHSSPIKLIKQEHDAVTEGAMAQLYETRVICSRLGDQGHEDISPKRSLSPAVPTGHSTRASSVVSNRLAEDSGNLNRRIYAVDGRRSGGPRYDPRAADFTPAANTNLTTAGAVRAIYPRHGLNIWKQSGQELPYGTSGIYNARQGAGDTNSQYDEQGSSTHAIGYQPHEKQARVNLALYGLREQTEQPYYDQDMQINTARTTGYPPQDRAVDDEMPVVVADRGMYQEPQARKNSVTHVNEYKHGSSLDGAVAPYYPNGRPHTPVGLTQADPTPIKIGPMNLETPHKSVMANRSEMLQALTENGQPDLHDLLDPKFLPFAECYSFASPSEENGVIAIRNIPYETTRGEIIALLGKSSKILNDRQEPVHIIMDRVTSKTQDAYCELSSLDAAIELVDKFKKASENGRIGRLGKRIVEIELSSQTNLMLALFPSTMNGVTWIGPKPKIIVGSQWPWENFRGFFTEEEMTMLSKHVENPQRSLYARICPERPYECMISTLRKIPWHEAEHITMKQRHAVYEATLKMIVTLANKCNSGGPKNNAEAERLTPQLLDRLVVSAMVCPGFSVVQKHNIATVADLPEAKSREFNQPRFPDSWRHQWALAPKPGMPIDVLEWYIAIIRAETGRVVQSLDISQRMPLQSMMQGVDGYWGFFWAEANFPVGRDWDDLSLAACSRLEWQAIERIITRAVQGGTIPPSYTSESNHIKSALANGPAQLAYKRY